jgi:uncharacterized integral membrane protein
MLYEWQFSQATALPLLAVFIAGVLVGGLIAVLVFKT